MTTHNLSVALAVVLPLAFGTMIETPSMTTQIEAAISAARELLLRDAWVHDVRFRRIAIESSVLVFRKTGELSETIIDDTGMHDATGTWELEESDGKMILALTGDNLRNKGRFLLKLDAKENAIDLQLVRSEMALRFQRRKGYGSSS